MNDQQKEKNLSDSTGEMSTEDLAYNQGVRDALTSMLRALDERKDLVLLIEEPGVKFSKGVLAEALVLANGTRTRRISQQ